MGILMRLMLFSKAVPLLNAKLLACTTKKKGLAELRLTPCFLWWAMQGLNLRPLPCEGSALPLS